MSVSSILKCIGLSCLVLTCSLSTASAQRDRDEGIFSRKGSKADKGDKGDKGDRGDKETGSSSSKLEDKLREAQEAYSEQDYEESLRLCNEVLKLSPQHPVALYQRASAQIEIGRIENSLPKVRLGIADARQALALAGNKYLIFHIPYFYGMTTLTEMEGRKDHAQVTVQVGENLLLRRDLESGVRSMVCYQIGLAQMALKDYVKAAAAEERALEVDPEFLAAHLTRAQAYELAGKVQEAEQAHNAAVRAFSDESLVFNNRGTFLLKQGRYPAAITDFDRALALNREFPMALVNRGYARSLMQNWAGAITDYRASLELDPEYALSHQLLAWAYMAIGESGDALAEFDEALEYSPQNPDVLAERGCARFLTQQFEPAIKDLTQALKLKPEYNGYAVWLYYARVMADQGEAAQKELQARLEKLESDSSFDALLMQFVLDEGSLEDLLQAAESAPVAMRKDLQCQAHFFAALKAELAEKPNEAMEQYVLCVKTAQSRLPSFIGAMLALADEKTPATTTPAKKAD